MKNVSYYFRATRSRLALVAGATLAIMALSACRSPLVSSQAQGDVTLSFIMSGLPEASEIAPSSHASRLILPTATKLTVTLTGSQAGSSKIKEPLLTILDGKGSTGVTFEDVLYGEYTVTAEAKDASDVVLFKQTSTLAVPTGDNSRTLNLVPASPAEVPLLTDQSLAVSLEAGTSKAWRVPAGSAMLRGFKGYMTPADESLLYFVQSLAGKLLAWGHSTTPIDAVGLLPDTEFYLTFYNSGAASRTFLYSLAHAGAGGIETVKVPGGKFQRDAEVANVSTISPFYIGKYEITEAQWATITGKAATTGSENKPKTNITWFDMVGFCNALSAREGLEAAYTIRNGGTDWDGSTYPVADPQAPPSVTLDSAKNGYRLPTEMEWEWAAMGATKGKGYSGEVFANGYTKLYAGDDPATSADDSLGDYAWYNGNSESSMQAIGAKLPNELGLYDMSGNASEWCQDYLTEYPGDALINYTGPASGSDMVIRGGAYDAASGNCVVSDRTITDVPSTTAANTGFRVAKNGQPLYTVVYSLNGGMGSEPEDSNLYDANMSATVTNGNGFYRTGFFLDGWNTQANGGGVDIAAGASLSMTQGSRTLYAKWIAMTSLTFDAKTYFTTDTSNHPAWSIDLLLTALRSGPIVASSSTVIERTFIPSDLYLNAILFNYEVSSKASVGTLKFEVFIDGTPIDLSDISAWSGLITRKEITYNFSSTSISGTTVTLRWTYSKNDGDNSDAGADAAWIDGLNVTMSANAS